MTVQQPSADDPTAFRPPGTTPAAARQFTPGTILGGRYRIVSLIGRGGMGEVYRADDLKLGQTVALKFFVRHGNAARLYEEVRIGRQISHPNVCRLYDIAEVDGQLFITMEFVDGEDLASLLRRVGRLSPERALTVTRDICAGVTAAHEKGVVHRDLKPANVMIDGRGRARVTDFGLAIPSDHGGREAAGTPAYMAPEQIAGTPASIHSDIYSLGLVLYEVFTGRPAFEGRSAEEVDQRKRKGDFARPSIITREIPADVERLITRCLDPLPESRPASAQEMLRSLPGLDPLTAAIAAGETPSPAMVAAAAERGDLPRQTAWALLGVSLAGLLSYTALTARTTVYRQLSTLKSPDVLSDRVEEILAATRQPLKRADSAAWFVGSGQSLEFHWRQSPGAMSASSEIEPRVRDDDPPLDVPGMAEVITDPVGELRELTVVPPRIEAAPGRPVPVTWDPFLQFAGFSGTLSPVAPQWASPVDSDAKRAWFAANGSRIEAAAYHGRPVWFAVIPPGAGLRNARSLQLPMGFNAVSGYVTISLFVGYLIAAMVLANRNLRRRQGDRRGATVIAASIFAVNFVAFLIRAHHPPDLGAESLLVMKIAFGSTFIALLVWLSYVAIEPLVRRRWPAMLIGWSRLIEGRLRDPIVGRDLLIGGAAGTLAATAWQAGTLVPGTPQINFVFSALSNLAEVGWFLGYALMMGVLGAMVAATMLLVLHVLTRNFRLSVLLCFVSGTVFLVGDATGPLWYRIPYAVVFAGVFVTIFIRFGLLAFATFGFPFFVLRLMPLTLDSAAWYSGRSLFVLLLMSALFVYAFIVSLGGKGWLPEVAVDR